MEQKWKRIGKAFIFPKKIIIGLLTPIAIVLLILSAVIWDTASVPSIISYVVSAYTLTVWCFRIPDIIKWCKRQKNENKYLLYWRENPRFRVNVTLAASIIFNCIFAAFQLFLGIYHGSFWFYSIAGYYLFLAAMRYFLFKHTKSFRPGERMRAELIKYRNCGWVFLAVNLSLSVIVLFMIKFDRTFIHHEITTIAIAAYTFTAFTLAIVNLIKFRKFNSPAFSASKAISLAAACVSMITLESTMLTTFGDPTADKTMNRILLGATGAVVSAFLIVMAIFIIVQSTKKLKNLGEKQEDEQ
ncbi:MAG: hypothetical protein IJD79_02050 [Clostridia bacterium]|nr:hypothetical protein [Clostridia bacterium]